MKSHFLFPLLLIALISSTSAQSNDFEGGTLSPWLDASIATVRWVVEDYASPLEASYPAPNPVAGTKYARAIRNGNLDAGAVILSSDTFTASPGDAVSFSFWIRSRRTLGNTLELVMAVGRNETTLRDVSDYSQPSNFEWRKVDPIPLPITAPTSITLKFFGYIGIYEEDAIAIDDIVITSGGGQTTLSTSQGTGVTSSDGNTGTDITMTTPSGTTSSGGPSECGGSISAPSGVVSSPNYPNDYGNNRDCKFNIVVPAGKTVKYDIEALYTQLDKDYLEIYDGPSITDTRLTRISGGPYFSGAFRSTGNEMLIRFTSDDSNDQKYDGFTGTFIAE